ncbi:hypothetical protein CL617_05830 [archaeon]|nr:hypothetical protein [archaeon]|tara:strand:+ start:13723 stop:14082 length:360 start_codon:yes stop_codon:yes gene_type:complete
MKLSQPKKIGNIYNIHEGYSGFPSEYSSELKKLYFEKDIKLIDFRDYFIYYLWGNDFHTHGESDTKLDITTGQYEIYELFGIIDENHVYSMSDRLDKCVEGYNPYEHVPKEILDIITES